MSIAADTDVDRRVIRAWRRTLSPQWLPRSRAQLDDATAATLSQLHHPRTWRAVVIQAVAGGHFTMTVDYRRGAYPQTILLGSWDAVQDVSLLVNDHSRLSYATSTDRQRLKREWKGVRFTYEVIGSEPRRRRAA